MLRKKGKNLVKGRIVDGNLGGRKSVDPGTAGGFSGHENLAKCLMRVFGLTIGL